MSLFFAAALAASSAITPVCSWDAPGRNVFTGDVPAAVDRYTDIPAATRARLKARMAAYDYDDVAAIRRDSIDGKRQYSDMREMHFGASKVCRTITRDNWSDSAEERGLVYCEGEHCVIVPTVCRNVSRVTRAPLPPAAPPVASAAAPAEPLAFEPPGAGGSAPSFASAAAVPPAEAPTGIGFAPPVDGGGVSWVLVPGVGGGGGGPGNGGGIIGGLPPLPAVPEPHSLALWAAGLATLWAIARRRRHGARTSGA